MISLWGSSPTTFGRKELFSATHKNYFPALVHLFLHDVPAQLLIKNSLVWCVQKQWSQSLLAGKTYGYLHKLLPMAPASERCGNKNVG